MIGKKLFRVEHYVYIGGVGGETKTTIYPASAPDFPDTAELPLKTIQTKLEAELEEYVKALGLQRRTSRFYGLQISFLWTDTRQRWSLASSIALVSGSQGSWTHVART